MLSGGIVMPPTDKLAAALCDFAVLVRPPVGVSSVPAVDFASTICDRRESVLLEPDLWEMT